MMKAFAIFLMVFILYHLFIALKRLIVKNKTLPHSSIASDLTWRIALSLSLFLIMISATLAGFLPVSIHPAYL
jgi:hypothetical protein